MVPVNERRGEIEAVLDGRVFRLCLTLGALAELEHRLGASDLMALTQRFAGGRLSARDAIAIIGAGLRGAGHDVEDGEVEQMEAEGGARGYIDIVSRLLRATFAGVDDGAGEGSAARPQNPSQRLAAMSAGPA